MECLPDARHCSKHLCVLTHGALSTNDEGEAIIISRLETGKPTCWDSNPGCLASMFFAVGRPSVAKQCEGELTIWKSRLCKGQCSIDFSSSVGLHGKFPFHSFKYAGII